MLLSSARAQATLKLLDIAVAGTTATAVAMLLFPLFRGEIATPSLLAATLGAGLIGLLVGCYLKYRCSFDSNYGFGALLYVVVFMELMIAGGAAALATQIGGSPDLRWFAFFANAFCMVASLLGGVYREAKALPLHANGAIQPWREQLGHEIDFAMHRVRPALTNGSSDQTSTIASPMWIIAVGSANIPLLFELYGGGRLNAIFLVVPVLTGTLAYVNVKTLGPGLVRLWLLRKLEKEAGRRFANADLEQIQELRRRFFLSRWLMKDYTETKPAGMVRVSLKGQKHRI